MCFIILVQPVEGELLNYTGRVHFLVCAWHVVNCEGIINMIVLSWEVRVCMGCGIVPYHCHCTVYVSVCVCVCVCGMRACVHVCVHSWYGINHSVTRKQ